ncbi:MAG: hypothetical protein QOH04_679 [Sphingomonadales bacterium]|jgi:hypothetical protein|nr:hypothetical protein [Sphingomonadales bacterium]
MTLRFVAYIDEAGDEGLGKLKAPDTGGQSRWLVIGAMIVREENDNELPQWRNDIRKMFPNKQRPDLHFRYLNHGQRVAACDYLSRKRFGICCVCSNKTTLLDNAKHFRIFKQKGYLYNYLTRYLLERVTSSLRTVADQSKQAVELRIIFSKRPNTDYHAMRDYLILMRDGRELMKPVRSIDWTVFSPDNIRVENHSLWAGLQLADIVTSATASGLEPNKYGNYEPRYATALASRFLAKRKNVINCGLTLVPPIGKCPLDDDQRAFVMGIKEKWQAPGP